MLVTVDVLRVGVVTVRVALLLLRVLTEVLLRVFTVVVRLLLTVVVRLFCTLVLLRDVPVCTWRDTLLDTREFTASLRSLVPVRS